MQEAVGGYEPAADTPEAPAIPEYRFNVTGERRKALAAAIKKSSNANVKHMKRLQHQLLQAFYHGEREIHILLFSSFNENPVKHGFNHHLLKMLLWFCIKFYVFSVSVRLFGRVLCILDYVDKDKQMHHSNLS
jgi:hypothetical protein